MYNLYNINILFCQVIYVLHVIYVLYNLIYICNILLNILISIYCISYYYKCINMIFMLYSNFINYII